MIKRWLLFSFLTLTALLWVKPVSAAGEFATSYNVNYQVESDGSTHTSFAISLKNKLSNIYAKEFSLSIGSTNLSQLKAYGTNGELDLTLNKGQKTTNLVIPFTDKVLGKDRAQEFVLEFISGDFANQSGEVWDITIPKLQSSADLESYQLTLSIPLQFGEPTVISPKPVSQVTLGNYQQFRFNPADLVESGISATFGSRQWFDFSLTYHLENSNVYPVKTEIALPPDTAFQKVYLAQIDPAPEQVSVDPDGNWLASFSLSPRQTLAVVVSGTAELRLLPEKNQFPAVDTSTLNDYLKPQQFWEVDNQRIKELAETLKTPRAIYHYVVDNLIYDYGRLTAAATRFGAANALDTPDSALCLEFTDLFIALARAAGIPARAVNGYALTNNAALRPLSLEKDVLHAWPEYYDENRNLWVPVDPTWGNTTGGVDYFSQFDLNHFAFVKQGLDSTYPIPAGAYKLAEQNGKDVAVDFGRSVTPTTKLNIVVDLPNEAVSGVPIKGQVLVKNIGSAAVYDVPLTVSSDHFSVKNSTFSIPQIPPFGFLAIPLELPATSWTDNLTDTVIASSGSITVEHQILLHPAYDLLLSPKNLFRILTGLVLTVGLLLYRMKP